MEQDDATDRLDTQPTSQDTSPVKLYMCYDAVLAIDQTRSGMQPDANYLPMELNTSMPDLILAIRGGVV